jgi:3-keto-disaccharide hydrolase
MRSLLRLATIALAAAVAISAARADDPKPPAGFTALFNGKDLAGWQGNIDMKQRATLPKEKLDDLLAKRTKTAFEHWSVKDGVIYTDGKGGVSLQTTKDFGNFELLVDWKIEKAGDSGIYLRGQPQVQIWDSDNLGKGLEADAGKGSGGLWNNPKDDKAKQPLKKADKPVGEWNTFHITVVGDEVTVKLNGEVVVDKGKLLNFFERDKDEKPLPAPKKGPIELQTHQHPLWFKNIYIKELP